jgi:hypothetical protein
MRTAKLTSLAKEYMSAGGNTKRVDGKDLASRNILNVMVLKESE